MRTKQEPVTDEQRQLRAEQDVERRRAQASEEERALDAAVRKSIKLHGA
jgi:hypothetical protein